MTEQHTVPLRARRPRRSVAVAAVLAALALGSCGGVDPDDSSTSAPSPEAVEGPTASPAGELATMAAPVEEPGSGGGGEDGGEDDETIPPYDSSNDRTGESEGVPEPCLLLTPALVSSIHGAFDLQQQVNGPGCVYISAEPLFEVSLFTLATSTCDGIVSDLAAVGRAVEDETFEGRIISWSFGDGNGNAFIFDTDWCFQLKVLNTGADRATMTGYVDRITDDLG